MDNQVLVAKKHQAQLCLKSASINCPLGTNQCLREFCVSYMLQFFQKSVLHHRKLSVCKIWSGSRGKVLLPFQRGEASSYYQKDHLFWWSTAILLLEMKNAQFSCFSKKKMKKQVCHRVNPSFLIVKPSDLN